jgi:predicted RNA-binding Zn-ribbon protein involved in translation (DUF1610 family)
VTRIRAACPTCGEVDLRPDDIHLDIVRGRDGAEVGAGSTYRFPCPACEHEITKTADEQIARLLIGAGVALSIGGPDGAEVDADAGSHLPAHPEGPRSGPDLTLDDLLDFHELLAGDDWFAALESMTH